MNKIIVLLALFITLIGCNQQFKQKTFNYKEEITIKHKKLSKYKIAVLETNRGTLKFKFFPEKAPKTTHRIKELIYSGFYNGIVFHRVVPDFVIQAGDPSGTGLGGSGKKLKAEFNDIKHERGILSMARAMDPDSADSQFFIVLKASPHLDEKYTVFGELTEGLDIIDSFSEGDTIKQAYLTKK